MTVRLVPGDCLDIIPRLVSEGKVVDSIVTDPPYHLTSGNAVYDLALTGAGNPRSRRATKGGGFMGKAWDGGDIAFRPETWATIGTALKPGCFMLAFGGSRTHHRIWSAIEDAGFVIQDTIMWLYGSGFPKGRTQLKPSFEPICVAYKPGGKRELQIDECRIPTDEPRDARGNHSGRPIVGSASSYDMGSGYAIGKTSVGRWPANVVLSDDPEVMEAFAAFGESGNNSRVKKQGSVSPGWGGFRLRDISWNCGDAGTAARFFYCAKADGDDRFGSKHPTVKPVELISWLVKLVTPPQGTVLDCFAGSGTTAVAAMATGRNAILIERDETYCVDIRERIAHYDGAGRHSIVARNRNRTVAPAPLFDTNLPPPD